MTVWNETVPPGISPEEYHESRVPAVIGVAVVCMVVSIVSVVLRFIARYISGVKFWWDDWFALANVPSAVIQPVAMFLMIHNGLGRNPAVVLNTDPSLFPKIFPKTMAACFGIVLSLSVFKWSVLALYYRIFRTAQRLQQSCIILGAVIAVWFVIGEVLNFFRCMPDIGLDNSMAGPCVITDSQWNYYVAIPTVVFDVLVVLLPVKRVWTLQLQQYQRIAIIGIFALGSTVTAVSCYKVYLLAVEISQHQPWSIFHLAILAVIEIAVGMLGCSITTYGPFIYIVRVKLGLTTGGFSNMENYGDSSGGRTSGRRSYFGKPRSEQYPLHDEPSDDLWELGTSKGVHKFEEFPFRGREFHDPEARSPIITANTPDLKERDSYRMSDSHGVLRTTEIVVQKSEGRFEDRKQEGHTQVAMPKPVRTAGGRRSPSSSEIEFARRGA